MNPSEQKRVWPLALAHGLNDGYGAFLSALMPLIIEKLGISLTLAGLLTSVRSSIGSFAQWPLGLAADRFGARTFAIFGPLLTAFSMCFLGLMPSYWGVVVLLVLAGLGTAALHPAGASLVPEGRGRGLRMALFSVGGTLGVALGPILVTQVVSRFGVSAVPFLLVPAVLIFLVLCQTIPEGGRSSNPKGLLLHRHPQRAKILRLWGMGMFRDVVGTAVSGFLAVLWVRRGAPLTVAGLSLTVYSLAGAVGDLLGAAFRTALVEKRFSLAPCSSPFLPSTFSFSPTALFLSCFWPCLGWPWRPRSP